MEPDLDLQARLDRTEADLATANRQLAEESARVVALELEVDHQRGRYRSAMQRMATIGDTIAVAEAAVEYLNVIGRRSSSLVDVETALARLAETAGVRPERNLQHEHIVELEDEVAALRSRIAALQDDNVGLHAANEDLEGSAADWQELAEVTDRQLVDLKKKLRRLAQDPAELRHALGHIAECEDNCSTCRKIAEDALERTKPS